MLGEDRRDGLCVARRTEQAKFERCDRDVGEDAARLARDPRRIEREDAVDAARVLRGDGREHRERMAAQARDGEQVRLQARAAGRIGGGEGENDRGRRRHALISDAILLFRHP